MFTGNAPFALFLGRNPGLTSLQGELPGGVKYSFTMAFKRLR
jgi:hypothetical protein